MRTIYAFTQEQNSALTELLSDRAALASLAGSLTITSADLLEVLRVPPPAPTAPTAWIAPA